MQLSCFLPYKLSLLPTNCPQQRFFQNISHTNFKYPYECQFSLSWLKNEGLRCIVCGAISSDKASAAVHVRKEEVGWTLFLLRTEAVL